jgi:signal transduction histidine kinase
MTTPSDSQLLDELKKRFRENKRALYDLRIMTKKLDTLNKKLQESEALKSNFLSNIRNEMIDPLAAIVGLSAQLLSKPPLDKKILLTNSGMIHSEAFNLDFQLKNIFAAAEIEAGETSLNISNVDVCALIKNTIEFFQYKTAEKNIMVRFICNHTEKKSLFQADPIKLDLIVSNLLSNAIEFGRKNSKVIIKANMRNNKLILSVQDSGIGIKKSDQKVIFDRFKQLETGVSRGYKGHGLGLSVVKSIIEILHGKISVTSRKGAGSIFKVTLPGADLDEGVFSSARNEYIFEEKEL